MAILKETVHHALGTFPAGANLPDDHPLVRAAPQLFTDIGNGPDPAIYDGTAKPGRPRKAR